MGKWSKTLKTRHKFCLAPIKDLTFIFVQKQLALYCFHWPQKMSLWTTKYQLLIKRLKREIAFLTNKITIPSLKLLKMGAEQSWKFALSSNLWPNSAAAAEFRGAYLKGVWLCEIAPPTQHTNEYQQVFNTSTPEFGIGPCCFYSSLIFEDISQRFATHYHFSAHKKPKKEKRTELQKSWKLKLYCMRNKRKILRSNKMWIFSHLPNH